MILAPEINGAGVAAVDELARVFLKAVQANRALPNLTRVRGQRLKDSLAPLMEFFGVTVRVASRVPAPDTTRSRLQSFMEGFGR